MSGGPAVRVALGLGLLALTVLVTWAVWESWWWLGDVIDEGVDWVLGGLTESHNGGGRL